MDERRIRRIFDVSIILKGLHALIEIAGGLAFYLFGTQDIVRWVEFLTQGELSEDPRDLVATHLLQAAQGLTDSTEAFYAFYLVSHGLIKGVLVVGLLKRKLVAYPLTLVAMTLFIAYQIYRYSYTHSAGLIVLTVFDVFVMALVWHEWRVLRRSVAQK